MLPTHIASARNQIVAIERDYVVHVVAVLLKTGTLTRFLRAKLHQWCPPQPFEEDFTK